MNITGAELLIKLCPKNKQKPEREERANERIDLLSLRRAVFIKE